MWPPPVGQRHGHSQNVSSGSRSGGLQSKIECVCFHYEMLSFSLFSMDHVLIRRNAEMDKIFRSKGSDYYYNTPQDRITTNYWKLAQLTDSNWLQSALKRHSSSPEAFFYLRNRMASSHGAMCAAHWILGVGDRHLSNALVSTKTGDFVGIDFGMAFGFATIAQILPELVPFRLTRQFQQLIPGLGVKGNF